MASKSPKKTQNKPALNTRAVQGHTTPTRLVEHKTAQQVMYAGPIPPPEILAELKKIHPESVDIVFKIAEREQNNHIRESEERHTRLMKAMEFEHTENMYALWLLCVCCLFRSWCFPCSTRSSNSRELACRNVNRWDCWFFP